MKKLSLFFLITVSWKILSAQNSEIDSLKKALRIQTEDTNKANLLNMLSRNLWVIGDNKNSRLIANQALSLSEKLNFIKGKGYAFHNLGKVNIYENNILDGFKCFSQSLRLMQGIKDAQGISRAYFGIAETYEVQGNYPEALKYYFTILKMNGDKQVVAVALTKTASINTMLGNDSVALQDYLTAADVFKEIGDKNDLGNIYSQISDIHFRHGRYPEALKLIFAAKKEFEELGTSKNLTEYIPRQVGDIHLEEGRIANNAGDKDEAIKKFREALDSYKSAFKIIEETGDSSEIINIYIGLGNVFIQLGMLSEAKDNLEKSLRFSLSVNDKSGLEKAYNSFSILDSIMGNYEQAYKNYKLFIKYRDSTLTQETSKKLMQTQMNYQFDKKELLAKAEQDKKDSRQKYIRNIILAGLFGMFVFSFVVFRQRNRIKKEKKRSDQLLLNILPIEVAEELKQKGSTTAKQFEEVTVMFTDFKNFTKISEKLSPSELVAEIDICFQTFDNIITRHNIEKIKTIGDSYMCAGGIPVQNRTNAVDVVFAAIEIQNYMSSYSKKKIKEGKEIFEIRIGIHTGPVVAGVVGIKKFAYDIWGDTVNIASRMESSGEASKINISGNTYNLVKDKCTCTYRGKIPAKNKGDIDMYFVESIS
jgi:class 3 adenylate cyclase/tetratricopeptide (TPR) repeat protein